MALRSGRVYHRGFRPQSASNATMLAKTEEIEIAQPLLIRSYRKFVAVRFRARDGGVRGRVACRWDIASRNASHHHVRGVRRAPQARTPDLRARTDLDHLPQLRAATPGSPRWSRGARGHTGTDPHPLRVEWGCGLLKRRVELLLPSLPSLD